MSHSSEIRHIYADNAATTSLLPEALDAMMPYLRENFANSSALYSLGRQMKKALNEAREIIAGCINADPDEIIFTSGGTESDNWAIKNGILSGDVLTTQIEHHAILNACSFADIFPNGQRKTHFLPVTSSGLLESQTLEHALSDRVSLVSVMLANNEIGTIEPIQKFAGIAHRGNALFHTDAVQAVGHIPIDVNELETDMLSASAHKFGGPKGIGFLFIRKGISVSPLICGGQQEFGKRAGTENIAAVVGMAAALKNSCGNMKAI